jgi:hypothetical protein
MLALYVGRTAHRRAGASLLVPLVQVSRLHLHADSPALRTRLPAKSRFISSSTTSKDDLTSPRARAGAGPPHKREHHHSSLLNAVTVRTNRLFIEDRSGTSLTTPDAVSTVPTVIHGDWVLFHPVYSEEEVKAVEVS